MAQSDVEAAARRISADVFLNADQNLIDSILGDYRDGSLSEAGALRKLTGIRNALTGHLIEIDREAVPQEWRNISKAIELSEERYLSRASKQFYIGTFSLPIYISTVLSSLYFDWQSTGGAIVTSGLLGAGLAALAAHAFFVLRVHQQASLAAERLSEKRLALLFLKLALGTGGDERRSLLDAGTSMFLGHQAPETIPLTPDDFKLLKDKVNE